MQLLKKLLKRLAKLLGMLISLVVVLYLAVVAINWNDVPPSELALQFEDSLYDHPPTADDENAYLAIRDLAGSADDDFPREPSESELAIALAEDCRGDQQNCLQKVTQQQYGARHWLDEHQWVLDRYIRLLSFTDFKEPIPKDATSIMPYDGAGYGQRLLMMSALVAAIDGDQPHVIALLEADLKFWRMVLANSEILITKMIAAAYVRNHFLQGNQVLRELHKTRRQHTLPLTWLEEISQEEHSLRRIIVGEWHFGKYFNELSLSETLAMVDSTSSKSEQWALSIEAMLMMPLYKKQDNKNIYAADLQLIGDTFDVPLRELPAAIEEYPGTITTRPETYSRVFNIAGDIYLDHDFDISYKSYFARTADLEGVRRAAVVTTLMREQQVAPEDVAAYLEESKYRDPYTDEPFDWDEAAREVRFDGLRDDRYDVYQVPY